MNLIDSLFIPINKIKKTIGKTDDTSGSSSDGTVMGKLNNIISNNSTIKDNVGSIIKDNYLYSPKMELSSITINSTTTGEVLTVRFVTNEKIYCTTGTHKIFVYDARTMVKIGETPAQDGMCRCLIVYDGKIYYSNNDTKRVIMFDDSTYLKLGESVVQTNAVATMFASNGRLFCNILYNSISVLNASSLSSIGTISAYGYTDGQSLLVYNEILYVGTSTGIKLYNAATRSLITTIDNGLPRNNLFVSDSILFATNGDSSSAKIFMYNITDRSKIAEIDVPTVYNCKNLYVFNGIINFISTDGVVYLADVDTKAIMDDLLFVNSGSASTLMESNDIYYISGTLGAYYLVKSKRGFYISYYERSSLT